MALQVLPHYPRGELILDPLFYTSSVFVDPMRNDIQVLLDTFQKTYTESPPPRHVFQMFKDTWKKLGWHCLHLCALEDVGRDEFLITVFRLFIERIQSDSNTIHGVAALFGLYTAYFSQPFGCAKPVRVQHQIALPIDIYATLPTLFSTGIPSDIKPYTSYVISRLMNHHAFLILPPSSTNPYNPIKLPRATLQPASTLPTKKTGRKSKKEKAQIAMNHLKNLEKFVADEDGTGLAASNNELEEQDRLYMELKRELIASTSSEEIRRAEEAVLNSVRELDNAMDIDDGTDKDGLRRVEDAMRSGQGLLNLLNNGSSGGGGSGGGGGSSNFQDPLLAPIAILQQLDQVLGS